MIAVAVGVEADGEPHDDAGHHVAHHVIKLHGALVDVADLGHHAVQVQTLHQHPGERTHEEIVQDDGHQLTRQLGKAEYIYILTMKI